MAYTTALPTALPQQGDTDALAAKFSGTSPRWAEGDGTNTDGQGNPADGNSHTVAAPPDDLTAAGEYGFAFDTKPSRQNMNWWMHRVYQWLGWLYGAATSLNTNLGTLWNHVYGGIDLAADVTGILPVANISFQEGDAAITSISNTTGYTASSKSLHYVKIGRLVTIRIPATAFTPSSDTLQVALNGTFSAFAPAPSVGSLFVPCIFEGADAAGHYSAGILEISSTSAIKLWWHFGSNITQLNKTNMPSSLVGLAQQDVSFLQG